VGLNTLCVYAAFVDREAAITSYLGSPHDVKEVLDRLRTLAHTRGVMDPLLLAKVEATLLYRRRSDARVPQTETRTDFSGLVQHSQEVHGSLEPELLNKLKASALLASTYHDEAYEPTGALWNDSPRNLLITETGYVGNGPTITDIGDSVFAFGGFEIPFLLRPCKTHRGRQCWKLVVPAYVEGITDLKDDDDGMQRFRDGEVDAKELVLC